MITERGNSPRMNLFLWISQAKRTALSEKAEHTAEHLQDHSEAIFSMAASATSAPVQKMRALLDRDDFEKVATRYMVNNWFLNVGLSEKTMDEARKGWFPMAQVAIRTLRDQFPARTPLTGKEISDQIEAIADAAFRTPDGFIAGQGHGTPVLLREALGLPGDHEICCMETQPEVLLNAANALIAMGVRLDAYNRKALESKIPNPMIHALANRYKEKSVESFTTASSEFNSQPENSETCGELYQGAQSFVRRLSRLLSPEQVQESMAQWFSDPARLTGVPEGSEVRQSRLQVIESEVRFLTHKAPEPEDTDFAM